MNNIIAVPSGNNVNIYDNKTHLLKTTICGVGQQVGTPTVVGDRVNVLIKGPNGQVRCQQYNDRGLLITTLY